MNRSLCQLRWRFTEQVQYADSGTIPEDQNYFNGGMAGLKR